MPPAKYTASEVEAYASEVFGGIEQSEKWLARPHEALGGRVPRDMLRDDEASVAEVMRLIGRIDHGVF